MNDLRAIISSALLGTERSPLGQLENPHLEQTRQQLEPHGQARQLLGTAMLALNLARAGQTPNGKLPHATPAPEDLRAEIPQAARERLQQLFAQQADLIPEWLELANSAGFRVPHQDVIALLDYGRQHLEQRQKVLPLLDSRGRWLAQQNPHLAWAVGDTSSLENALETWELGSKAARVLALQTIRQHNPEQARGLLETVWKSEPADERKNFLALFAEGLTEADEPFLESSLDDRSKDVRAMAADFLTKLPNSAFVNRMKTRAMKLLQNSKKELEVILPEWEDTFARDAIEKKPVPNLQGAKAFWLEQIVTRVPLSFWETHLQLEPKEILNRLPKDWQLTFINAFLAVSASSPDQKWSQALLDFDNTLMRIAALMNTLPIERREAHIRQYIFRETTDKPAVDINWVTFMRHNWDIAFTQAVWQWLLAVAEKILNGAKEYSYFGELAHHINLATLKSWQNNPKMQHLLTQLETAQDTKKNNTWHLQHCSDQLKTLFLRLETRAQMRKELQP